ncbi:MAG: Mth938-like domain-containing protein [Rhodoferax sp.]|nr:Mth938-like domain-containing protein [Rhodoferax sp.]MDP3653666.1 Mth938-like domain-containing protein [Rhodoferax sp.]
MKLQADAINGPSITGYGPGWVAVNGERFTSSIIINSASGRLDWECARFEDLQAQHFEQLATVGAELVLFGSGERIRFPQAQWLQSLYARRIGVETMDTQAACRTYNFLAGEGRRVVAALLL